MNKPFFDDMAKIAGTAMSSIANMKNELEAMIKQKIESYLSHINMVQREEYEVLKDLVTKLQANQALLEERIERLESQQRKRQGDQE